MWGIWKFKFWHTWLQAKLITAPLILVGMQFCADSEQDKKIKKTITAGSLNTFHFITTGQLDVEIAMVKQGNKISKIILRIPDREESLLTSNDYLEGISSVSYRSTDSIPGKAFKLDTRLSSSSLSCT